MHIPRVPYVLVLVHGKVYTTLSIIKITHSRETEMDGMARN